MREIGMRSWIVGQPLSSLLEKEGSGCGQADISLPGFGVVSSAFAFHVVCVWYGLKSAPTHHNHSLTTGPIFGVQLTGLPYYS
jgi:hypothetical protein